jgi:hypothetical protein
MSVTVLMRLIGSDTGKQSREPDTFIPDFRSLLYSNEWADVLFVFPQEVGSIRQYNTKPRARSRVVER